MAAYQINSVAKMVKQIARNTLRAGEFRKVEKKISVAAGYLFVK
jgi:hypothetical protein